jgi:hypothetical protein
VHREHRLGDRPDAGDGLQQLEQLLLVVVGEPVSAVLQTTSVVAGGSCRPGGRRAC